MRDLKELPITEETSLGDMSSSAASVSQALLRVPVDTKEMAYQAWLGFYNSQGRLPWTKEQLVLSPPRVCVCVCVACLTLPIEQVQQANNYSAIMGLAMPPALEKKTIGKMGLKGVPGLRIDQGQGGGRGDEHGGGGGGFRQHFGGGAAGPPQQQLLQQTPRVQQPQQRGGAPQRGGGRPNTAR
jgi:ATP-dependent RNA helicase MSS116